jgi:homoserine/homoserine lactone efflux protein
MDTYLLFVAVAALAILSPGPGVVMTLSNAARDGLRGALAGILGIACGAWVVAALSATGLGLLLAASGTAFQVAKWLGAAYLVYLGVRLWRAPAPQLVCVDAAPAGLRRRFGEGLSLQVSNPKAIAFFLSVLPQFMPPGEQGPARFVLLVLTYAGLILVIHSGYALAAQAARRWLQSPRGARLLQRTGGLAFIFFGAALAASRR